MWLYRIDTCLSWEVKILAENWKKNFLANLCYGTTRLQRLFCHEILFKYIEQTVFYCQIALNYIFTLCSLDPLIKVCLITYSEITLEFSQITPTNVLLHRLV